MLCFSVVPVGRLLGGNPRPERARRSDDRQGVAHQPMGKGAREFETARIRLADLELGRDAVAHNCTMAVAIRRAGRIPALYSPKCVEDEFSEVHFHDPV